MANTAICNPYSSVRTEAHIPLAAESYGCYRVTVEFLPEIALKDCCLAQSYAPCHGHPDLKDILYGCSKFQSSYSSTGSLWRAIPSPRCPHKMNWWLCCNWIPIQHLLLLKPAFLTSLELSCLSVLPSKSLPCKCAAQNLSWNLA